MRRAVSIVAKILLRMLGACGGLCSLVLLLFVSAWGGFTPMGACFLIAVSLASFGMIFAAATAGAQRNDFDWITLCSASLLGGIAALCLVDYFLQGNREPFQVDGKNVYLGTFYVLAGLPNAITALWCGYDLWRRKRKGSPEAAVSS